jgi:predicted O-methyltransferase YrrM
MRAIGYRGYTSYELCHQLPVVNGRTVGIEFAHKNAQLAVEFMREIIRSEYATKPATVASGELIGAV